MQMDANERQVSKEVLASVAVSGDRAELERFSADEENGVFRGPYALGSTVITDRCASPDVGHHR